jgi:hypothetical protein
MRANFIAFAACLFMPVSSPSQPATKAPPAFILPVACEIGRTCEIQNYVDRDPTPAARDYQCGSATYDAHSGVDFRILDMAAQRRGVNVLAAADGKVLRVRDGIVDVSVREIDRATLKGRDCGNGVVIEHDGGFTTQYCHMRNASLKVRPGQLVRAGAVIGQIGLSGNTEYPHLHITFRRGDTVIDPFAPLAGVAGRCGDGAGIWQVDAAKALIYKGGAILNIGFAAAPMTMADIEDGQLSPPTRNSAALIAYVRAINLRAGDVQDFTLKGPDGTILASHKGTALTVAQAQRFLFIGKNRAGDHWRQGLYRAHYRVIRSGTTLMQREFDLRL